MIGKDEPQNENLRPLSTDEFAISSYLEYFEIPSFRPLQEEAVQAIINNERPLVLMPTGGGSTLVYTTTRKNAEKLAELLKQI